MEHTYEALKKLKTKKSFIKTFLASYIYSMPFKNGQNLPKINKEKQCGNFYKTTSASMFHKSILTTLNTIIF